ncbi:aromatic-ring-hydroxylating dioxygenase subunit beta [Streptomyces sp. RB6PN25]|uniref:Aromatic-ring-hydroxylating dioxygenase subunit beta n=1 Tax=Streptomyces humicola TaxID=2953240 RepID=A0ABT1PNH4_9ACTN|nr:aromatic-ring-hydroxylating dioxygenase subunit beta [Streptomyces humicola]MCQ4079219.1 aromatic-ring-hydroxylating dioxygenase subunit beta [Streptomyces humicola]
MTATIGSALDLATLRRDQVEDFLFHEAALLDDWDLDEWLALFTPDASYVIPCNDDPDGDPDRDLVLVDDNMLRLSARVERLNSRRAHREYPHSRTNHQVSNVRLSPPDGDELAVTAQFTVWRFRNGRATNYVGRYHYRLVVVDGLLRIRAKRVVLDMTTLRPAGDMAIIL